MEVIFPVKPNDSVYIDLYEEVKEETLCDLCKGTRYVTIKDQQWGCPKCNGSGKLTKSIKDVVSIKAVVYRLEIDYNLNKQVMVSYKHNEKVNYSTRSLLEVKLVGEPSTYMVNFKYSPGQVVKAEREGYESSIDECDLCDGKRYVEIHNELYFCPKCDGRGWISFGNKVKYVTEREIIKCVHRKDGNFYVIRNDKTGLSQPEFIMVSEHKIS